MTEWSPTNVISVLREISPILVAVGVLWNIMKTRQIHGLVNGQSSKLNELTAENAERKGTAQGRADKTAEVAAEGKDKVVDVVSDKGVIASVKAIEKKEENK